jgi:uncharacterized glyoxalase superfamily protein PhnB
MQRVTPYLLYPDGQTAVDFLTSAFGFRVVDQTIGAAGGMHVELETPGGGRVFLGQPPSGRLGTLTFVVVDDVDAHYEAAKAAGAEITEELWDVPVGHRRYTCRDAQGHEWSFAQVLDA